MSRAQEWDEFLDNLFAGAVAGYKNSREYELLRKRQEQLDELLTTNLSADDKAFVEEILFEVNLIAEREAEAVYHQGIKDCIWLLKNLGGLA